MGGETVFKREGRISESRRDGGPSGEVHSLVTCHYPIQTAHGDRVATRPRRRCPAPAVGRVMRAAQVPVCSCLGRGSQVGAGRSRGPRALRA